jgi:hypothetical protein
MVREWLENGDLAACHNLYETRNAFSDLSQMTEASRSVVGPSTPATAWLVSLKRLPNPLASGRGDSFTVKHCQRHDSDNLKEGRGRSPDRQRRCRANGHPKSAAAMRLPDRTKPRIASRTKPVSSPSQLKVRRGQCPPSLINRPLETFRKAAS